MKKIIETSTQQNGNGLIESESRNEIRDKVKYKENIQF